MTDNICETSPDDAIIYSENNTKEVIAMTELPKWFIKIKDFGKVFLPAYLGVWSVSAVLLMLTANHLGNGVNETILAVIGLIIIGLIILALLNPISIVICAMTATALISDLLFCRKTDENGSLKISRDTLTIIMILGTVITLIIGTAVFILNASTLWNFLTVSK